MNEDFKTNTLTPDEDGKYRWTYEMSLLKNPTIFMLIWKIFFFILLGIFGFMMIIDAIEWDDFFPDRLLNNLKFMGIFLVGMTVLVAVGYLIYAGMMGWKYIVEFEMDEKGVNHRQIEWQAEKARKIVKKTTMAGALTGNYTTMGVGMNAQRTEMYTEFVNVKKVIAYPHRKVIKVNALFNHNQVYVRKEDFEFVKNYIAKRCVNAKIK